MPLSQKAPPRGRYDRSVAREERVAAQRERLLNAVAQANAMGTCTVARVLEIAGVGRATFYEYFDDAEHALAQVVEQVTASARRAVKAQHSESPNSIESLFEAWLIAMQDLRWSAIAALRARGDSLSSPGRELRDALVDVLASDGSDDRENQLHALMLAGAAQAAALDLALGRVGGEARASDLVPSLAHDEAAPANGAPRTPHLVDTARSSVLERIGPKPIARLLAEYSRRSRGWSSLGRDTERQRQRAVEAGPGARK
jgi:AcrR family transcriptional regulator